MLFNTTYMYIYHAITRTGTDGIYQGTHSKHSYLLYLTLTSYNYPWLTIPIRCRNMPHSMCYINPISVRSIQDDCHVAFGSTTWICVSWITSTWFGQHCHPICNCFGTSFNYTPTHSLTRPVCQPVIPTYHRLRVELSRHSLCVPNWLNVNPGMPCQHHFHWDGNNQFYFPTPLKWTKMSISTNPSFLSATTATTVASCVHFYNICRHVNSRPSYFTGAS